MDAGLAAVLGALAGAVGTTMAGMATGWASREQAKITARSEHLRQRREPRQVAYGDLLRAAAALRDHMMPMYGLPPEEVQVARPELNGEFCNQGQTLALAIRESWLNVVLAGPVSLAEGAEAVEHAASRLSLYCQLHEALVTIATAGVGGDVVTDRNTLTGYREARSAFLELSERLAEFMRLCQPVLDDDGTN
ncbi:hypothetical protein ABZ092_10585 [Streptomyces bobili]|uniref:hypothetical protein n=1 Tax=Streptomyces bobili TaxID=67280 RepID=UPI0033A89700